MSLYSLIYNIFTALICLLSWKLDSTIINMIAVFFGITALFAPIMGASYRLSKKIEEKNSENYDLASLIIALFTFEYSLYLLTKIGAILGIYIYIIAIIVYIEINRRVVIIECEAPVEIEKEIKRKVSNLSILCFITEIVLLAIIILLSTVKKSVLTYIFVLIILVSPLIPLFVKKYRINNHLKSKVNNLFEKLSILIVPILYEVVLKILEVDNKPLISIIPILTALIVAHFHKKIYPYYDDYKKYEPVVENEEPSYEEREISVSREKKINTLIKANLSDKEYNPESLFYARIDALLKLFKNNNINKMEYSAMAKLEIKPVIIKLLNGIISNEYNFYGESFSVEQASEYAYNNCIIKINDLDELENRIDKIYASYNTKVKEKAKTSFPQIYTIYKTYYNNIMNQLSSGEESSFYRKNENTENTQNSSKITEIKEDSLKDNEKILKEKKEVLNNKTAAEEQLSNQSEKLFCRKCGAELVLDSEFCYKCGTKVIKID